MALNGNVRPNDNIIYTGNVFSDSVSNTVEILRRELIEDPDQKLKYIRRLTDVLEDDAILIPKPPCITVYFTDWEENFSTIGQRYPQTVEYKINLNVYYYHSEINNKIRDSEIRDALWEISRIIRRNSDLNGLSSKGVFFFVSGGVTYKQRNDKMYQGGIIRLMVPVIDRERRSNF